ncbi:hypothetical protein N7461_006905 [Penicillium sp. DV-2018c]|nr:hypothetical protein N7461_006905 [Penicillium sp. DV-2018c]
MRRNHQRSLSKPFQLPTQRRPDFSLSQSSRTGIIDQLLVEGSQQPRASSPSPRKPFHPLPSSSHDEDPQLDAFDLELLASEERENALEDAGLSFPRSVPLRTNRPSEIDSPQISRFFSSSTSITPSRSGNGTSSSDPLLGSPTSPCALFRPRKNSTQLGQRNLGTRLERYLDENTQSSRQILSTQANQGASASNEHRRELFSNLPPSVRGIVLVPVNDLPKNYHSLFPFPLFNAIQSKSFHPVYNSNDNIVLSAPTGSGKTVIMELAICKLLDTLQDERFKVVYQAPTKSLCSERFRDWHSKFSSLSLKCAELTGDTDHMQLRNVQNSQIIITTPEKWDSITRKWKDHMKLMQLVKLFLIDEVHILKETRGATLEAVVSRMKNIGSNVRFVALSATVPNSEDIATWLGKDATNQHLPAHREHFGEGFRPVKLQKFVYGYQSTLNDFAFDKVCGSKLPEIIGKHSCQKPIMIFCCTRNSSLATAKELARLWTLTNPPARHWKGPQKRLEAHNEDLKATLLAGVAFHHAGLGPADRHLIETGFRDGHISVICCTSTLAVGVNLPCQLVIIKNTVSWQEGGCKEYSDLEMMQMLGRAGRPQYDDSATAVILTRKERVAHYEKLVQGSESLESCLHLNLIDHLNAEIGLGHISDVESAVKWLAGTFLFVRLRRNPTHYKLKEGANQEDEDELLRQICEKDIDLLRQCDLVDAERLCSTQFGDAMARYYINFETMKVLLSLKPKATLSETLEAIAQAQEFHEIRLKPGDKPFYRVINRDPGIRFPIKVDLALQAHKVSLLLQCELGAIEFPDSEQFQKHKFTFQQEKTLVFAHVHRLIRCLIDCQIARGDSIAIRNALELARSFGAKVWDHSPLQMKQIEQVGVVAVRKLAAAGITSIEELECAEAHQIEMVLSRNPPFGSKLLSRLKEFPKLRVAVKLIGKEVKNGSVNVRFRVEVAFMNDKTPTHFLRRPVYVCCLTERSDGQLIDFRRTSASKLQEPLDIELVADLTSAEQVIVGHVMCDDIGENSPTSIELHFTHNPLAGTSRQAELKLNLPSHIFAVRRVENIEQNTEKVNVPPQRFIARRDEILNSKITTEDKTNARDSASGNTKSQPDISFDGDDLDLDDFFISNKRCGKTNGPAKPKPHLSDDMDWFSIDSTPPNPVNQVPKTSTSRDDDWAADMGEQGDEEYEPVRLANGKWACNHKCKDKTSCKHFCCREGLEKPPKPPKRTAPTTQKDNGLNQLTISASITKSTPVTKPKTGKELTGQRANKSKHGDSHSKAKKALHSQPTRNNETRSMSVLPELDKNIFSFRRKPTSPVQALSSDYGDDDFDDLPPPSQLFGLKRHDATRTVSPLVHDKAMDGTESDPVVEMAIADVLQSSLVQPEPSRKDQTEPPALQTSNEIIVIDDTPTDSAELSIPSDRGSPALQDTMPQPSLKRKASEDDSKTEASPKRQKQDTPVFALQDHARNALAEENPLETEQTVAPVPWTGMDLTATWDDGVDLVDEFKDIIKFI